MGNRAPGAIGYRGTGVLAVGAFGTIGYRVWGTGHMAIGTLSVGYMGQ